MASAIVKCREGGRLLRRKREGEREREFPGTQVGKGRKRPHRVQAERSPTLPRTISDVRPQISDSAGPMGQARTDG